MAEVVLDANVLVGLLYAEDAQHGRARALADRLERDGHELVLLAVLVGEAVSVLCRRARERKASPPGLAEVLAVVRGWFEGGHVRGTGQDALRFAADVIDTVAVTGGVLNFNDALLVVLQRQGVIDDVASFDSGFDAVAEFRRIG